ncbi:CVNH domain-containing protein [Emcibacter sp. SYSU 3D8]|uniref:CVNH domain-containing protein n=1 Tax=Emcibacter sp. SYSU 3D8 TaxID=3133969 RepID=UPI0031FF1AFD
MPFKYLPGIWCALLCLGLAAPAGAIPIGSYRDSCKDIKLKDRDSDSVRIQARCLDGQGEWRRTSFELDRCWGELANIDGELVCVADQSHGGPGFAGAGYDQRATQPAGQAVAGHGGIPGSRPKDVAVDVCIERAVREAYRGGAGYARLLRIEDIDRKDAGRIKVKGIVLASEHRESRKSHDMPFRCDSRAGVILEFRWR